ncbi:MAG: DNA repair protein RecN [Flavobacteriales bacterium]|nr:DNA repair protein RecN [Flavobacteriales bacterium]
MLQQLQIQNYALIENLNLQPGARMTAITGETGSGKSILLGALGLILGERADTKSLRDPEKKCIIEGTFLVPNTLKDLFDLRDLDYESTSHLRREITPSGKSRAFVNDTPVSLSILKEIGGQLVDIHSQQDQSIFHSAAFRFEILDISASCVEEGKEYQELFKEWRSVEKQLEEAKEQEAQARTDEDYWQFQLDELNEVQLDNLNVEDLEQKRVFLDSAADIQSAMSQVSSALDGESGVLDTLHTLSHELKSIEEHGPSKSILDRIQSVIIELDDLVKDAERVQDEAELDPEELYQVKETLDLLYKLQHKHRLNSIDELVQFREELSQKLSNLNSSAEDIERLTEGIAIAKKQLLQKGESLGDKRKLAAQKLEKAIEERLRYLGMERAELRFEFTPSESPTQHGIHGLQILFKANPGSELQPLSKVASGGEMSRVLLVLKSVLAGSRSIPTIIFDEIDTGVSGDIALKMANMMHDMSDSIQLICITHLAQVASKADEQLKVSKESSATQTFTQLKTLQLEERILELAEMLSGKEYGDEAVATAKALLNG